ncbi:hypothetical protein [Jiella mangrovi]|uniref:Uncharacterized protein n=1 Tax=Jiella mangrovi TaxID=2821407 RepID=A0ABS4BK40_9HYPH|nr:hypothetical protein [Jiella mangrovi]MBP0617128.1 hypothetical protein [Jiella mangrovi]
MKVFLAATAATGLVLASASGALACSFKKDVTAEAPMTPIVTADQSTGDVTPAPTAPVIDQKKG